MSNKLWKGVVVEVPGESPRVSHLVPANAALTEVLHAHTHFESYLDTGVGSETLKAPLANPPRLPNLWFTSIGRSLDDTLFEAFRSATIVHYGEPDESLRRLATAAHLRELLEAAAYRELSGYDPRAIRSLVEDENPIEIHFTSIDLQSYSANGDDDPLEKLTIDEAREAFRQAEAETLLLPTAFGQLRARFMFQLINLPSHPRSFRVGSGWGMVDHALEEIRKLLARAKVTLGTLDNGTRTKVARLSDDIAGILERQSYREPTNIYGLAARVLNLAFLIGDTVHMNCRSGKDRTGMLDVEAKFVAWQQDRLSTETPVSAYDELPLPTERAAWRVLLLASGNTRVQELNSGYVGSKLTAVSDDLTSDPFVRRVGQDDWDSFVANGARAQV